MRFICIDSAVIPTNIPLSILVSISLVLPPPPKSTPFPYTTLFRSSTEFEGGIDADVLDSRVSLELTAYRRSEENTSELQSRFDLVCRHLLEKNTVHYGSASTTFGCD